VSRLSLRVAGLFAFLIDAALPSLALAAEGGEHHNTATLLWQLANFIVLAFILIKFAGPQLKDFLFQRRKLIADQMDEARRLAAEAQARDTEWAAKLERLEAERENILAQAREIGRVEQQRILDQARREAERIQEDAARAAEQELARARMEIREEAVRVSMDLAEKMLRENVHAEDQKRLVEEYLEKVGRVP
jgi:F-type H+-transporting ATPase subunit b